MAMDFSGRIGRVIDNPVEAQSAAMEEGHAWRVRQNFSFSVNSVNNAKDLYRWRYLFCFNVHRVNVPLVVSVVF